MLQAPSIENTQSAGAAVPSGTAAEAHRIPGIIGVHRRLKAFGDSFSSAVPPGTSAEARIKGIIGVHQRHRRLKAFEESPPSAVPSDTSAKYRGKGIHLCHLRHLRIKAFAFAFLFGSILPATAQVPAETDSINPHRAWLVAGGTAVFATGSLIALNEAWYKGYERTSFHFFNDGDEWYQMDKLGHAFTSYQLGRAGHAAFRWAGFNEGLSTWVGGSVGLLYLTGIEYLDGHSAAYGFSCWDMAANTAGTALFIGQQLGWHDQRMLLKWSSHLTDYAPQRPDVLGATVQERLLKDYNGTTIWLSANPHAFGWKAMPVWLNFSAGMGADGMIYASGNPGAYRQFYLAPDIAFSRIRTRSKLLKTVFFVLDALKMPAPTVEFRSNGDVHGYWLYF